MKKRIRFTSYGTFIHFTCASPFSAFTSSTPGFSIIFSKMLHKQHIEEFTTDFSFDIFSKVLQKTKSMENLQLKTSII